VDKLKDARVFSTLGLKNGILLRKSGRRESEIHCVYNESQYRFLKAPFGLSNSSPVFQRFINQIFRPLINIGIMTRYLDDIIILAADFTQAVDRLETVLILASEYK